MKASASIKSFVPLPDHYFYLRAEPFSMFFIVEESPQPRIFVLEQSNRTSVTITINCESRRESCGDVT